MSSNAEVEAAVVEKPSPEPDAAPEEPKPVKKNEKNNRAAREKKPKQSKSSSHPPYFQMIQEALLVLNEKSGSSPYAIAKYMEEKHKGVLPANFRKTLALQLKNSAAKGKLIKVRASYKLSDAGKKEKGIAAKVHKKATATAKKQQTTNKKKPVTKKVSALKAKAEKKPETPKAKKGGAKKIRKSTPGKPKQPKSIKSPGAKRARKATV